MKIWKLLLLSTFIFLTSACGGGGGGSTDNSGGSGGSQTPANFTGMWSGTYSGTGFLFSIAQTGANVVITRQTPPSTGITYTGVVNGNVATVTTFANSVALATSTWTLQNNSTIRNVVTSCTPTPSTSCAAVGTELILSRLATPTGNMTSSRAAHTATLLQNGKVLLAGGYKILGFSGATQTLASAEIFDPATGSFAATGNMSVARVYYSATLLQNGKVLIAGGDSKAAEIYDPASGSFSTTGNMTADRQQHTAVMLQSGKVLVTGGVGLVVGNPNPTSLKSAELYDPATGTFTATGNMNAGSSNHNLTLLANGRVLVTGSGNTAEIYDPAAGTFTVTGSTAVARFGNTATLLSNGKVLVASGSTAELYDPIAGTFSATGSMALERTGPTATLQNNGKVLFTGGSSRVSGSVTFLSTSEVFDPSTGVFTSGNGMTSGRAQHTATALPNGKVLVVGGITDGQATLSSADFFE